MRKTTVYLDPKTDRGLQRLSRKSGKPQALIIRRALSEYVARHEEPKDLGAFIGCVKRGDPGLADRAETELREMAMRGELGDS